MTQRTGADRCPGVFSTHAAADGALARIRLPGGRIRPDQLAALAQVSAAHADGHLELTARGNLQLRGITDVDAVADAVVEAGLASTSEHDTLRNIEVSPLTGRIGGLADVRPVAEALDGSLRDARTLAPQGTNDARKLAPQGTDDARTAVSGRFLFGIDDGRGDIARRRPDACAIVRAAPDGTVRAAPDCTVRAAPDGAAMTADILVGGRPAGSATGTEAVVDALLDVAAALQEISPGAWRVGDLDEDGRRRLAERVGSRLAPVVGGPEPSASEVGPLVGWFDQDDGAVLLGAVVELGRLPARLAEFIAAVDAPVIVTPDREILLCDLGEGVAETVVRVLAPMGLIFDANSPWVRVSCCVGAPACASGHAPVREDLLLRVRDGEPLTEREHWVGCARGCGSPAQPHLSVRAVPGGGYENHHR